jgi:hypothetical protein
MFCFLINNEFYNFWANSPSDIFVEATINGLNLDRNNLKIIYFPKLRKPEFFTVNEDNSISIKEKIESVNENNEVMISYNIIDTIQGDLYYHNGSMLINC